MRTENPWRAHLLPLLLLAAALGANQQKLSTAAPVTLPGCPDKCGEVSIPYPFGTKDGCFLPGFQTICNQTFDPPRAFFAAYDPTFPSSTYNPLIVTVYRDYFNDDRSSISRLIRSSSSPIELTGVSVGEGRLQVRASFSLDCKVQTEQDVPLRQRGKCKFPAAFAVPPVGRKHRDDGHREVSGGPPRVRAGLPGIQRRGILPPARERDLRGAGLLQIFDTMVTIEEDRHDYRAHCSYAMLVDKA